MWTIHQISNTVKVGDACEKDLRKVLEKLGRLPESGDLVNDGELYFDPDHYEHRDYMSESSVQKVMKKHKVCGDITFGDLEGGGDISFWGYRFDGKGGMKKLKGEVIFKETTR